MDRYLAAQEIPRHLMWTGILLPLLEEPATSPVFTWANPVHSLPFYFFGTHFLCPSHLAQNLQSSSFRPGFPTKSCISLVPHKHNIISQSYFPWFRFQSTPVSAQECLNDSSKFIRFFLTLGMKNISQQYSYARNLYFSCFNHLMWRKLLMPVCLYGIHDCQYKQ
jgi:hypothetical protein